MMINRLLVPLDGSPLAEIALDAVALLAKRFHADVVLVRMIPEASSAAFTRQYPSLPEAEARAYLEQVAHWLRGEGGVARTAVHTLAPAQGIVSEAKLEQVDLIVMTTHGRTGLDAFLHPSVTWQVLTQTAAPILACHCVEGAAPCQIQVPRFMLDPTMPILVALDGSLQAEQTLPLAQEFARAFGNPLLLARAAEPVYQLGMEASPQTVDDVIQWSLKEAQSYLQARRLELMSAGFTVETVSGPGLAAPLITTWVQQYHAGLVVLASHGRGWLGRVVLGSVARSVLGQVQEPLLLLRQTTVHGRAASGERTSASPQEDEPRRGAGL